MSRILFVNHASVGHLNTLLTMAVQMKADGHDVLCALPGMSHAKMPPNLSIIRTTRSLPKLIEANGIPYEELKPPFSTLLGAMLLPKVTGYVEFIVALNVFSQGMESYARQLLKVIEKFKPDVLVTDFAFFGASLAADIAKIPYVTIYHAGLPFDGENIPPVCSGLPIGQPDPRAAKYERAEKIISDISVRKNNKIRRKYGLQPSSSSTLRRPYSPWLNLVTSVEAIEAPRDVTPNTYYIGPCFQGRKSSVTDFPFEKLRADKFKIYVSLGTVFNERWEVYRKIMNALDNPAYQVIVSAGASYDKLQAGGVPSNVMLFKSVPQVELLPKVDMVIGHGGNNSTNETLAAGKPLIVLPVGGEQTDNASRIEWLGAGQRLNIHKFTEADVARVVAEIHANPHYAERTRELAAAITQSAGPQSASRLIAKLAREQRPLDRQPGESLTVKVETTQPATRQGA
jgi:MGT family glycosyltransferase